MIKSKPLGIGARLLIILTWCAVALADVIIVDDHVIGFAILIGTAYGFYKFERLICGTRKQIAESKPQGKFWLQYADGHYQTITDETLNGVRNAMANFNWEAEVAKYKTMGKDRAAPGLGLGVFGEAHFVHITTTNATSFEVLYVRGGKEQTFKKDVDARNMARIVVYYMVGDEKKMLEELT